MRSRQLRGARLRLGLTRGQAARLFGVDPRAWRSMEGGQQPIRESLRRMVLAAERVPGLVRFLAELPHEPVASQNESVRLHAPVNGAETASERERRL